MKITDNRTIESLMFGKLLIGDIFYSPNDSMYFMVTTSIGEDEGCPDFNAVCLDNGKLDCFYDSDLVIPVKAELIIS